MKKNFSNLFLIFVVIILSIWVVKSGIHAVQLIRMYRKKSIMEKQKKDLKEKNKYLQKKLKMAKSYSYIKEKNVRFKLGLKKKKEKIIKLEKIIDK